MFCIARDSNAVRNHVLFCPVSDNILTWRPESRMILENILEYVSFCKRSRSPCQTIRRGLHAISVLPIKDNRVLFVSKDLSRARGVF